MWATGGHNENNIWSQTLNAIWSIWRKPVDYVVTQVKIVLLISADKILVNNSRKHVDSVLPCLMTFGG